MKPGVWIDSDIGFDDIVAILIVRAAGLRVDGLSLVFGNTRLEQVEANAAAAAKAFNWRFPIYSGCARAILGSVETAERILGPTGIVSQGQCLAPAHRGPLEAAFSPLCDWLCRDDHSGRILALGPLTNIAALLTVRPDLAARIDSITWMGGGATSGNHTPSAEFNAFADPEAVAIVLSHGVPIRFVDLDFCRQLLIAPEAVLPIRALGGRNAALIADLLDGFLSIGTRRKRSGMSIYDAMAAVAFVAEDIIRFVDVRADIELAGILSRGRTIFQQRDGVTPNAKLAVAVETAQARAIILGALAWEAGLTDAEQGHSAQS